MATIAESYHRCEDGKWAAFVYTKDDRLLVGYGRRRELAKRDLANKMIDFLKETLNAKDAREETKPADQV
jgi:hypothetical protein